MYRTIVRVTRNVSRNEIRQHSNGNRPGGIAKSRPKSNFQSSNTGKTYPPAARPVNRMVPDAPTTTDTLDGEMRIRQFPSGEWWAGAAWRLFQLLTIAAVA